MSDPKEMMIRLDDFLKQADLVGTGGEAKVRIQSGEVMVNGEVETRRRRQLHPGDEVVFNDELWMVEMEETANEPAQPEWDAEAPSLNDASLVVVAERPTEAAAMILVNVLADEKIRAIAVGGFTAGFRAESPGWVQVKTFEKDAKRAREIIDEVQPLDA